METFVAGLALVVSIIALAWQIHSNGEQMRLQERLGTIEQDRRRDELRAREDAPVTASFDREQGELFLVLRNRGPAAARHVDMEVSGPGVCVLSGGLLPLDLLPAGQTFSIVAAPDRSFAPYVKVRLTWKAVQQWREEEMTLYVP